MLLPKACNSIYLIKTFKDRNLIFSTSNFFFHQHILQDRCFITQTQHLWFSACQKSFPRDSFLSGVLRGYWNWSWELELSAAFITNQVLKCLVTFSPHKFQQLLTEKGKALWMTWPLFGMKFETVVIFRLVQLVRKRAWKKIIRHDNSLQSSKRAFYCSIKENRKENEKWPFRFKCIEESSQNGFISLLVFTTLSTQIFSSDKRSFHYCQDILLYPNMYSVSSYFKPKEKPQFSSEGNHYRLNLNGITHISKLFWYLPCIWHFCSTLKVQLILYIYNFYNSTHSLWMTLGFAKPIFTLPAISWELLNDTNLECSFLGHYVTENEVASSDTTSGHI